MTRVALLTEIPAPYRISLFNALAGKLDLRVLFLAARNPERPYYEMHADELDFAWEILPGVDVSAGNRWLVLNRGVRRRLRGVDAVLLGGWNQPAFWTAQLHCAVTRTPLLLWVESTSDDRRSGRLEPLKRRLLRTAAGFVVPGEASRRYLLGLGVDGDRITRAPNAIDGALFASGRRTRDGGPCRVVAVGRLAHEKGLDVLLAATHDLPVEVALAGVGPEEERLRALAGTNVRFLGRVARDDLPDLYANADVAALPSRSDPWGMVLNEAAAAGLPLVATTTAGAAHELIEEGRNGFRVPPDDAPALREALERLAGDDELRRAAGEHSREIAAGFTPDAWADAVVSAIERVTP